MGRRKKKPPAKTLPTSAAGKAAKTEETFDSLFFSETPAERAERAPAEEALPANPTVEGV